VPADVLITEATFGRPDYRFPPAEETRAALVRFAREALDAGETPVFLAYALGKAQEVMTALSREAIPVAAHGAAWKICDVYRSFGLAFPGSRRLTPRRNRRAALVVPPRFRHLAGGGPQRVAIVTGWGERALGEGIDEVFQLSDHADYDGLIRLVEAVRPQKTFVVHGYARTFAADLRNRGFDAEAVEGHSGPDEDGQLELFG
jgi:Cft2 family RNA processing exonuclease